MKATTEQVSSPGDPVESGARAARPRDRQDAIRARSGDTGEPPDPLPQRGDRFTEEQLRERFGLPPPCTGIPPHEKPRPSSGGIRTSETSTDIILVGDVHSGYDDIELGRRTMYDGAYRREWPDQMVGPNLRLAKSRENGDRLLYFTKEDGVFRFDCIAECVKHRDRDDPSRPGALAFELEIVGAAASACRDDRTGRQAAGDESGQKAARGGRAAGRRHDPGHLRIDCLGPRQHDVAGTGRAGGAEARQADSARYAAVVKIEEDEDGKYVATVPALPGCISQGDTRAQARKNLEEAISLHLEYLLETGEAFPPGLAVAVDVAAVNVRGQSVSAQVSDMLECAPT